MKLKPQFVFTKKLQMTTSLLIVIGILALGTLFILDPLRAWTNLLINNFYFLSLSLAGAFFLAMHYLSNAGWASNLKRIPEAMLSFLPVAFIIMLSLYFGMHSLYHWSHHDAVIHDALLQHKAAYLNVPFFFIRMVVYFTLWILLSFWLRKVSRRQDVDADLRYHRNSIRLSAIFIIVFAFTFSLAGIDWIMSLEPHWFSTIFGVYNFSSLILHGLAAITLIILVLQAKGYFGNMLTENHLHDLGKYIFGFSTFWAYIWVSQYLLIWYSNIPEETAYYYVRTDPDWIWLFALNLILNWLIPFILLMSRKAKRSPVVLKRVCITLMIGYWLDLFLLVAPNVLKNRSIGIYEILISLGFAGLFIYVTARSLAKAPLIAKNDPYFQESIHLHQ